MNGDVSVANGVVETETLIVASPGVDSEEATEAEEETRDEKEVEKETKDEKVVEEKETKE